MGKPSDGLGLLVLGGKPTDDEEQHDEAAVLASEGVLKAIKRGDAKALSRALKEHYACCQEDHYDDEDDEAEFEGNGQGVDED